MGMGEKEWTLGTGKPGEEAVSSSCRGIRCRPGGEGVGLVVPFIVLVVISGLVLPFVRRVDGFASLLHHVHQGTHQPLGALRWRLQRGTL